MEKKTDLSFDFEFLDKLIVGIGEVSQMIDVSDFYQPRNQTVYEAVIKLFSASQPVDAVLVANELLAEGNLEKVGGSDYLHSLVASVPPRITPTSCISAPSCVM